MTYIINQKNEKWIDRLKDSFCLITARALARILKNCILERVPVKKVVAAGETQVERAVAHEPSQEGSRGPP